MRWRMPNTVCALPLLRISRSPWVVVLRPTLVLGRTRPRTAVLPWCKWEIRLAIRLRQCEGGPVPHSWCGVSADSESCPLHAQRLALLLPERLPLRRGAGWRALRVARCVLCVARCLSCTLRAVLRASLCGPSLFSAGQVRPHRPRCMLHLSMRCSATCHMKGCMLHKPIMLHVASQHAVQRNMQHERYDASHATRSASCRMQPCRTRHG
jgi:hypothetical protein